MRATPIMCQHRDCDKPSTTVEGMRLRSLYGQKWAGLAFYYTCDDHKPTAPRKLNMSETAFIRPIEREAAPGAPFDIDKEYERAAQTCADYKKREAAQ